MSNNPLHEMAAMVRQFMTTFDQGIYKSPEHTPCEVCLLRSKLITEEALELTRSKHRSTDELDAICDLLYVVLGTNIAMSIPVEQTRIYNDSFWLRVLNITQDLDSRFPCEKIQRKALNDFSSYLVFFAECMHYKLLPAFKAVHCANMGKLHTHPPENTDKLLITKKGDLYLVKREDGKILKPSTFVPPDLTEYL